MAVYVGQPFLQGAEQREFEGIGHATSLRHCTARVFVVREIDFNTNSAAPGQSFDKPARGRVKAGFVKQWGMQQVGHGANAGDGMVDELARLLKDRHRPALPAVRSEE